MWRFRGGASVAEATNKLGLGVQFNVSIKEMSDAEREGFNQHIRKKNNSNDSVQGRPKSDLTSVSGQHHTHMHTHAQTHPCATTHMLKEHIHARTNTAKHLETERKQILNEGKGTRPLSCF